MLKCASKYADDASSPPERSVSYAVSICDTAILAVAASLVRCTISTRATPRPPKLIAQLSGLRSRGRSCNAAPKATTAFSRLTVQTSRAPRFKSASPRLCCALAHWRGTQAGLGQQYAWGHGVPADHAQALAWFRKSADQGNAHGQNGLGTLYERGWAVDKDFAQALNWFHRAADQGYPPSQVNIGLMYQSGEGVSQDYAEAMAWFKKAADQGYLQAYLRIGLAYRDGRGVDRNYAEAAEWFTKAADQGYADAELELGWFYENGLGQDKNNDRAKVWYQKAADQGNSGAQAALQRLAASNAPTASTAETTPPVPNAEAQSDEWLGWGDFNNKFKLRVSLGYYPETSGERSRRYPRPLGGAAARNGLVFLRFA